MHPNNDDDLSQLLRMWKPETKAPSRFRSSVWSQIATREERRSRSFFERLSAFFARPAYAGTVATLALGTSIGLAEIHSSHVINQRQSMAATSYLASINPLARVNANPPGHE